MSALNPSQRGQLVASFRHVDELLRRVELVAKAEPTPFSEVRADLSSDEARLLLSFVGLARSRMLAALERLGVPRPAPTTSGRWSVETTLQFAEIALAELRAETLAGYGAVDRDIAREVEVLVADLRSVIRRGAALLHERDPGALAERLALVPGSPGEILRELDRLSAHHGLADVRSLIAATAERASATLLDVGVFGRVGAGKSSLINALVGTAVLPVGATPVTAVPVSISRGTASALVRLEDGASRVTPLEEISAYVTEGHNPQNSLGVRSVDVTLPTAPEGVRFIDTPGVGSLASSGPAQAFAWLPRCDLGLVLLQAGSSLGREEVALVSGLTHAGIGCRLLVSKADQLAGNDADEVIAYVQRELGSVCGDEGMLDVHLVSTRPAFSARLDELHHLLDRLAQDRARVAELGLRTRLHRLVAITAAAIGGNHLPALDHSLSLARLRTRQTEEIVRETGCLVSAGQRILKRATDAVVEAWARGEFGSTVVRRLVLDAATDALAAVSKAVEAAQVGIPLLRDERGTRLPPLFDPDFLDQLPVLPPPRIGRSLLGPAIAAWWLRPVAAPLASALQRYADRLRLWGLARLDEVTTAAWETMGSEPALLPEALARLDALIER